MTSSGDSDDDDEREFSELLSLESSLLSSLSIRSSSSRREKNQMFIFLPKIKKCLFYFENILLQFEASIVILWKI
jgi:hypothetical protein